MCLSRSASFNRQDSAVALYYLKRNPFAKWLIDQGMVSANRLHDKFSGKVSACFSDDLLTCANHGAIVCLNSEVPALLLQWR